MRTSRVPIESRLSALVAHRRWRLDDSNLHFVTSSAEDAGRRCARRQGFTPDGFRGRQLVEVCSRRRGRIRRGEKGSRAFGETLLDRRLLADCARRPGQLRLAAPHTAISAGISAGGRNGQPTQVVRPTRIVIRALCRARETTMGQPQQSATIPVNKIDLD